MDTSIYAHILAIAEYGNISLAAEQLFLSRSTLSRQLQVAEKELGTEIFKRVSNNLVLTHAGEVFLEMARRVVAEEKYGLKAIGDITVNYHGRISVGAPNARAELVLPGIITEFNRLYPNVSIELSVGNTDKLARQLSEGKIDIAIMSSNGLVPNLEYDELIREEYLLLVPGGHPMACRAGYDSEGKRRQCSIEWFKDDGWAFEPPDSLGRKVCSEIFAAERFKPNILIDNCKYMMLLRLIDCGLCNGIALDTFVGRFQNLTAFSLNPRRYSTFVVARRSNYSYSKTESDFVGLIKDYYKKIAPPSK
jgi:LysR family cyn operon transcriptional activator